MPKIIENLAGRLMQEARRQIGENGYAATTIRSVAKACGVGVGTVYNYFPSKDAMIASYMLGDWRACVAVIEAAAACADSPGPVLRCVCAQLRLFIDQHEAVIRDETAAAGFSGALGRYHPLLRTQLAAPLRRFCADDFTAEFAAQALLTWTMEGRDGEELYALMQKLF